MFFTRLSNGYELAISSWQVLRLHKKLIVFPVLSGMACMLVLLSFATPFFFHPQWLDFLDFKAQQGVHPPLWAYAVLFAYYFCNYFVITYFNAALITCAIISFNGGEPTLGDGIGAANSRLPQIFAWALVAATVGVLLKVIENLHEKVGEIVSALLGLAWSILTFFVVPVLVVEKVGPFEAVARSTRILRRAWGEALVSHWGIGLFMFLISLPGVILIVLGAALTTTSVVLGIAVITLGGLYLLAMMAIGPALNGICLAALYQYAADGKVPRAFNADLLSGAFARKGR
jgi:Family of unknown function (DUF6159)